MVREKVGSRSGAAEREEEEEWKKGRAHNQKQEPDTKMWGEILCKNDVMTHVLFKSVRLFRRLLTQCFNGCGPWEACRIITHLVLVDVTVSKNGWNQNWFL